MNILNKKTLQISAFYLALICTISCKKEDSNTPTTSVNTSSNMTQLGEKLNNPFTVQNMSKALNRLTSSARISENIEIETSHLYIKFKPKSEEELDILKKDSTIEYYEYPLDYSIAVSGDYYHDPSLPSNVPTYQYASIPINQKIPQGVEYEIIDYCYIPDDLPSNSSPNSRVMSDEMADALIAEAFELTGNKLFKNQNATNARITASKWTPSGRIEVWDNVANQYVGVNEVMVKSRNWLTTREGLTNSEGRFTCNGTLRGADNTRYSGKNTISVYEQVHLDKLN